MVESNSIHQHTDATGQAIQRPAQIKGRAMTNNKARKQTVTLADGTQTEVEKSINCINDKIPTV